MISFTKAVMDFFGKKPGQTTAELAQELKQLTQKDKEELCPMLAAALGCEVEVPVAK